MASPCNVVVFTSSSGGVQVQKNTTCMINVLTTIGRKQPTVEYVDMMAPDAKKKFWATEGVVKGEYPVLFVDDKFIGNWDTVENLNEVEKLQEVLKVEFL